MDKQDKVILAILAALGLAGVGYLVFTKKIGMGYGTMFEAPLPALPGLSAPAHIVPIQGRDTYDNGGQVAPLQAGGWSNDEQLTVTRNADGLIESINVKRHVELG